MSLQLDELIQQLQEVRDHLNENGLSDVNPEVVISDAASRTAKNYSIDDGGPVGGVQAAMQAGINPEDSEYKNYRNFVYLFEGSEHWDNRYTPKAVFDCEL